MDLLIQYVPVALQWLLFLIMLLMGMTLTVNDFKRVVIFPKAIGLGLVNQLILLPLIGWLIITILPMEAVFAMGIIVVCASPGGAVSNLISHLSKGDTALSVSLTACSSVLTIISIPFIINFFLKQTMGASGVNIQLPAVQTIINIFKLTVLPVALGMYIHFKFPKFTERSGKLIAWISGFIIIFALFLIVVKLNDIGDVWSFIRESLLAVFILNVFSLSIGYCSSRLLGLSQKQSITISIETGMQNNVLGMAIATSPTLLNNALMAVPAGVYGLLMCTTAVIMIFVFRKMQANESKLSSIK